MMSKSVAQFNKTNFFSLCDLLSKKDRRLKSIIDQYGYPPVWTRPPTFSTLIHIILEQQVSLASGLVAFVKLKHRLKTITPEKILQLTDSEMKDCYFSRQKTSYAKNLADAIISKQLNLEIFSHLPDEEVKHELKCIKGIGDWTADMYLLFALQRTDIFPVGDLALINAFKEIHKIATPLTKEEISVYSERWKPYRSVATMLFWHYYLRKRGRMN